MLLLLYRRRVSTQVWEKMISIWYSWGEKRRVDIVIGQGFLVRYTGGKISRRRSVSWTLRWRSWAKNVHIKENPTAAQLSLQDHIMLLIWKFNYSISQTIYLSIFSFTSAMTPALIVQGFTVRTLNQNFLILLIFNIYTSIYPKGFFFSFFAFFWWLLVSLHKLWLKDYKLDIGRNILFRKVDSDDIYALVKIGE